MTITPALLHRRLARCPDAALASLSEDPDSEGLLAEVAAPLGVAGLRELLAGYLLDRRGELIADARADVAGWLDGSPMALRRHPGGGAPRSDSFAAWIAAPALVGADGLLDAAWSRRAAPRADEALAAAIALLSEPHALAAIVRLADEPLRDEEVLHLGLLQAGRALAWSAARLGGEPAAASIVDRLLALLARPSAGAVLGHVVAALGPVAATATPLGARVRERALAVVEEEMSAVEPEAAGSFLAEFERLRRGHQDLDWYRTAAGRRVAEHAAQLVGRGAHHGDRAALIARVADRWEEREELFTSFAVGVAATADAATVAAFVGELLAAGDEGSAATALAIGARVPVDACADALLASLRAEEDGQRLHSVPAVSLLADEVAIPALQHALDDDDPEVCAVAAVALLNRGRVDLLEARRLHGARRVHHAIIRAAIPDHGAAVLSTLVAEIGEALENVSLVEESGEEGAAEAAESMFEAISDSPLVVVLGDALRTTATGIARTTQLLREVPDALEVVALAIGASPESFALPPALAGPFGEALDAAVAGDPAMTSLALALRAQLGRGDAALAERLLARLSEEPDMAADLLSPLASTAVRSTAAADALVPMVAQAHDLRLRGAAAAVAGAVAPEGHPVLAQLRELLGLGTVLGDIAHETLVYRARFAPDPEPRADAGVASADKHHEGA